MVKYGNPVVIKKLKQNPRGCTKSSGKKCICSNVISSNVEVSRGLGGRGSRMSVADEY